MDNALDALGRLTGWTLRSAPTPHRGLCHWPTRTIILDPGLTTPEARSVLTHELVHAERGPVPRWMRSREEAMVRAIASRRLVDFARLAEAAAWSQHPLVIAHELDVDADTIHARVETLGDDERAHIDARLETIHLP